MNITADCIVEWREVEIPPLALAWSTTATDHLEPFNCSLVTKTGEVLTVHHNAALVQSPCGRRQWIHVGGLRLIGHLCPVSFVLRFETMREAASFIFRNPIPNAKYEIPELSSTGGYYRLRVWVKPK